MIRKTISFFLTAAFPFFLLMGSILVIFQPWFLHLEYSRKDFPSDPFGFSVEDRLTYGIDSLLYITRNKPDDFLAELSFNSGDPLYNERELSHMKDVKIVFQKAKNWWLLILLLYAAVILTFLKRPNFQTELCRIIVRGSLITITAIVTILITVVFAFQPLFTGFHTLFFTGDSWLFYNTDSLIRLYPEKLWIDGFTLTGLLTLLFSAIFLKIGKSNVFPGFRKRNSNSR
jgi:integral membrane protein (TIGR01906 family)